MRNLSRIDQLIQNIRCGHVGIRNGRETHDAVNELGLELLWLVHCAAKHHRHWVSVASPDLVNRFFVGLVAFVIRWRRKNVISIADSHLIDEDRAVETIVSDSLCVQPLKLALPV